MEFKLAPIIFDYFGVNAKREDPLKDINGKGIGERYQISLGESYDELLQDLIDNLLDNIVVPSTIKSSLIPITETALGGLVSISSDEYIRRKIIQFAQVLYNVRSTIKGYEIPLRILGFDTVTIVEQDSSGTFDDGTFDDDFDTFDSDPGCGCGKYTLVLTGSVTLTPDILEAIARIITFNEPINAELLDVEYHLFFDRILREDSSYILREDGSFYLREVFIYKYLREDSGYILREDNSFMLRE